MSDIFSNPRLFTSPTLMKSDDDVLLEATQSKQSVLSEEELKRAEAAARRFGIDQPRGQYLIWWHRRVVLPLKER